MLEIQSEDSLKQEQAKKTETRQSPYQNHIRICIDTGIVSETIPKTIYNLFDPSHVISLHLSQQFGTQPSTFATPGTGRRLSDGGWRRISDATSAIAFSYPKNNNMGKPCSSIFLSTFWKQTQFSRLRKIGFNLSTFWKQTQKEANPVGILAVRHHTVFCTPGLDDLSQGADMVSTSQATTWTATKHGRNLRIQCLSWPFWKEQVNRLTLWTQKKEQLWKIHHTFIWFI